MASINFIGNGFHLLRMIGDLDVGTPKTAPFVAKTTVTVITAPSLTRGHVVALIVDQHIANNGQFPCGYRNENP